MDVTSAAENSQPASQIFSELEICHWLFCAILFQLKWRTIILCNGAPIILCKVLYKLAAGACLVYPYFEGLLTTLSINLNNFKLIMTLIFLLISCVFKVARILSKLCKCVFQECTLAPAIFF